MKIPYFYKGNKPEGKIKKYVKENPEKSAIIGIGILAAIGAGIIAFFKWRKNKE